MFVLILMKSVFASDVDVRGVVDFGELFASGDFEGLFVFDDIFED